MIIQARPANQYGNQDMINYNMPGMMEYTPERGLQNDMQYYSNLNQMSALYTNPNGLNTNISPPQHQYNFANHSQLFPSQTPASKEGSSILNIQPMPTHLPAFNNPISEWTPVLHPVQQNVQSVPRLLTLQNQARSLDTAAAPQHQPSPRLMHTPHGHHSYATFDGAPGGFGPASTPKASLLGNHKEMLPGQTRHQM